MEDVIAELAYMRGQARTRNEALLKIPPRELWPDHIKPTGTLNVHVYVNLPMEHDDCRSASQHALQYLRGATFEGLRTSRTLKTTNLPTTTLISHIAAGIIQRVTNIDPAKPLPQGCNGINVWRRAEMKQRFRLISETHLNRCTTVSTVEKTAQPPSVPQIEGVLRIPPLQYLGRSEVRTRLGRSQYIIQLDIDAYYNSLAVDEDMQRRQLFIARDPDDPLHRRSVFCVTRGATGARWMVYVGQTITYGLVDIPGLTELLGHESEVGTDVITMMDNICVHATPGAEEAFVNAVRTISQRAMQVNLSTTPDHKTIAAMTNNEILALAQLNCTFLGEDYKWDKQSARRTVRNTDKTVAKLRVAWGKIQLLPPSPGQDTDSPVSITCRMFASLLSLLSFAMHTIALPPSRFWATFQMQRMISAMAFTNGWNHPVSYLAPSLRLELNEMTNLVTGSAFTPIPPRRPAGDAYAEESYDLILFVDASRLGVGALVKVGSAVFALQKLWLNELGDYEAATHDKDNVGQRRFSAHAEPTALSAILMEVHKRWPTAKRIAAVTDHLAIPTAARKPNGYGGIGHGRALNLLFQTVDTLSEAGYHVSFFYIAGELNPSDALSRVFPPNADRQHFSCNETQTTLPPLRSTYMPHDACAKREHPWTR